jgi:RecA-family ATPase
VGSEKSDNSKRLIGLLTLSEWDAKLAHISQGCWFAKGLLQAGWLLVIDARPKVGKSIVAVNLALALAEWKPFLNLPTNPCAVLYIDLERPLETLNRFKVLNARGNPNIFVPSERIGADMLDALRELIRQAKERTNRPVVVFVDTLGDFIKLALRQRKASINDYDAIAEILQELRDLALELGCGFVFVHHARKALSEEPAEVDVLGSTAIAGKFDVLAHLKPDRSEGGVLVLTAEGNAIAKTTLYFTIKDDFRLAPCKPPAKTKEERAALEIQQLLEQHPEGVQRSDLIRYLMDVGLAETKDGASRLFSRAVKLLPVETKRVNQRMVYALTRDVPLPRDLEQGTHI